MNNKLLNNDLKYGDKKENSLIPQLNKYFKCNVIKTKPFYQFDFIDEELKLLFELKSRRNTKQQYYDTMVGANKVKEGYKMIKQGYKVYFVFGFTDFISAYELNNPLPNKWFRKGGRQDRGKDEIKEYCFIPNHILFNLFSKNNVGYNIIPNMEDGKPKTNNERPLSYSQRLINSFKEDNKENYNIEDIEKLINDFSKLEYEKKKEKTDEMPFGKYKYKKVEDVAKFDKQYLKWLVKQSMMDNWEELKEEIKKVI